MHEWLSPPSPEEGLQVSVLICTWDRPQMLELALEALVDKTVEKPDEIIIVNSGEERADGVVAAYAARSTVPFKLLKTQNINLATSRNIGLAHCSCGLIAMTDDDAEVLPDWVSQIKQIHSQHPEAGAVGGAVIGADSSRRRLSRIADVATFVSPRVPCYVRNLPGVNVSYKHSIIRKLGPQDETLARGEDVDYNWRVKQLGYEVLYHPAMQVRHHHRPTVLGFFKQHHMYGRSYYLVRDKWRDMYCVYPHGLNSFRDILKGIACVLSMFYQPFQFAWKLTRPVDRLFAVPILFANQLAWKSGMIYQRLQSHR